MSQIGNCEHFQPWAQNLSPSSPSPHCLSLLQNGYRRMRRTYLVFHHRNGHVWPPKEFLEMWTTVDFPSFRTRNSTVQLASGLDTSVSARWESGIYPWWKNQPGSRLHIPHRHPKKHMLEREQRIVQHLWTLDPKKTQTSADSWWAFYETF